MIYYSGRGVSDLGMYNECNSLGSARYSLIEAKYDGFRVMLGFCGPITCELDDYKIIGQEIYQKLNLQNYEKLTDFRAHFSKEYSEESMDGAAIFVLLLWIILLVTVLSGTFFEYMSLKNPQKRFGPVSRTIMAFSLINNFNKLVSLPTEFDTLQLFNGVRAFTMIIVVFGHSYIYQASGAVVNPKEIEKIFKDFNHLFMVIYIVDFFFFMAGFLLAFLTIKELKNRRGRLNWGMFIAHRFVRIIPIYYFCFFTYNWLLRYMGNGPQWPIFKEVTPQGCDDYWWTNLLFVGNFLPEGVYECMGWSWYIANDIQFYVFSPIIFIVYYRRKSFGWILCIVLLLINWLTVGIEASVNHWQPTYIGGLTNPDQFLNNYVKPYARMAPYILGIMVGFCYRSTVDSRPPAAKQTMSVELGTEYSLIQEEQPKPVIDRNPITYLEIRVLKWVHVPFFRYVAYAVGLTCMSLVNFMPYQLNHYGADYWSTSSKAAFMVFDHFTFGFGFSLFVIPMLFGYCKPLLWILTMK